MHLMTFSCDKKQSLDSSAQFVDNDYPSVLISGFEVSELWGICKYWSPFPKPRTRANICPAEVKLALVRAFIPPESQQYVVRSQIMWHIAFFTVCHRMDFLSSLIIKIKLPLVTCLNKWTITWIKFQALSAIPLTSVLIPSQYGHGHYSSYFFLLRSASLPLKEPPQSMFFTNSLSRQITYTSPGLMFCVRNEFIFLHEKINSGFMHTMKLLTEQFSYNYFHLQEECRDRINA